MNKSAENISASNLKELRQIIVKLSDKELDYLQSLLNDKEIFAGEVAKILPSSFVQSQNYGDGINLALVPVIEQVLTESISARPQIISDTLAPIIGKTIRKSINSEFRKIIENVNSLVEDTFSLRGLKWRYQALVSRKKYGEIVLLNTLGYKTYHVLLIHRETGLLLNEVSSSESLQKDPDLIGGMLKAIMDFAHDSIDSSSTLETIDIGERKIYIETSERAILATVIKGFPPATYKEKVIDVFEDIQQQFAPQLKNFTGDVSPFVLTGPYLKKCLDFGKNQYKKKKKKKTSWIARIIMLAAAVALLSWGVTSMVTRKKWDNYIKTLHGTNGIFLTYSERNRKDMTVKGMRLPGSLSPVKIAANAGIDTSALTSDWGFVITMDAQYVKKLIKSSVYISPSSKINVSGNEIAISGTISKDTEKEIKLFVENELPDYKLDFSQTKQISKKDLTNLINEIEDIELYYIFATDSFTEASQKELSRLITQTKTLKEYSLALKKEMKIIITGHSDNRGSSKINKKISLERAQQVGNIFIENDFDKNMLHIEGKGYVITRFENITPQQKRRVDVVIKTDDD